jgi:hypothetical protein
MAAFCIPDDDDADMAAAFEPAEQNLVRQRLLAGKNRATVTRSRHSVYRPAGRSEKIKLSIEPISSRDHA